MRIGVHNYIDDPKNIVNVEVAKVIPINFCLAVYGHLPFLDQFIDAVALKLARSGIEAYF